MLRNPIIFGIAIAAIVGLQIAASYGSVASFFKDEIILGLFFFLFVPTLGLILGFYIIWFYKK